MWCLPLSSPCLLEYFLRIARTKHSPQHLAPFVHEVQLPRRIGEAGDGTTSAPEHRRPSRQRRRSVSRAEDAPSHDQLITPHCGSVFRQSVDEGQLAQHCLRGAQKSAVTAPALRFRYDFVERDLRKVFLQGSGECRRRWGAIRGEIRFYR